MNDPLRNNWRSGAFDAAKLEVMRRAMDLAWLYVVKADIRFADEAAVAKLRNLLAQFIIDAAKGGESDELELASAAISFVAAGPDPPN